MAVPSIHHFFKPSKHPIYLLLQMTQLIIHISLNFLQMHVKPNYSQKSATPFLSLWREIHTFISLIFLDSFSSHHLWECAFPLVYDLFFCYYYCKYIGMRTLPYTKIKTVFICNLLPILNCFKKKVTHTRCLYSLTSTVLSHWNEVPNATTFFQPLTLVSFLPLTLS